MSRTAKEPLVAHFQPEDCSVSDSGLATSSSGAPGSSSARTGDSESLLSFRDTVFVIFCDDEMSRLADED